VAFFRETGGKGWWSSKIIQASTTSSSTPGGQNFTGKNRIVRRKKIVRFFCGKKGKTP